MNTYLTPPPKGGKDLIGPIGSGEVRITLTQVFSGMLTWDSVGKSTHTHEALFSTFNYKNI